MSGLQFCRFFVESPRGGGSTRQSQRTEPCQCVAGKLWACHGVLQGQTQYYQRAARVVGPALGGSGKGAVQVVRWGCGFAGLWKFPEEESLLVKHSAQSPASVWVASPGHATEHCKVKCSLSSVQQVWWGLHWGRRQGCCAGDSLGVRFCRFVESSRGGGSTHQPQRTEPCQCEIGQPLACLRHCNVK